MDGWLALSCQVKGEGGTRRGGGGARLGGTPSQVGT